MYDELKNAFKNNPSHFCFLLLNSLWLPSTFSLPAVHTVGSQSCFDIQYQYQCDKLGYFYVSNAAAPTPHVRLSPSHEVFF